MFVIKYTVDNSTPQPWIDPNIRGNTDPMIFESEEYAIRECDELNINFNHEGYSFFVEAII